MTPTPDATLGEIRRLYFNTTPKTIHQDFDRALALLRSLPDEGDRQKATVYMEGLVEMRREWAGAGRKRR